MRQNQIGRSSLWAGPIGLGCMSIGGSYGPADRDEAVRLVRIALDEGVTLFDTADVYGYGESERVLGEALKGREGEAIIATKGGIVRSEGAVVTERRIDNSPAYLRTAIEGSLQRLGVDHIHLFYVHRRDDSVAIEEVMGGLAELHAEGKIGAIGLCEITPDALRRASTIHPVSAVQSEYSLWHRLPEQGMLEACKQAEASFVAFSPLGRGFLTGTMNETQQFDPLDVRRISPRFEPENMRRNAEALVAFRELAASLDCTPAQLALAWLMSRWDELFVIPGTKRERYLKENIGALRVEVPDPIVEQIEEILPNGFAAGDRYRPEGTVGVQS